MNERMIPAVFELERGNAVIQQGDNDGQNGYYCMIVTCNDDGSTDAKVHEFFDTFAEALEWKDELLASQTNEITKFEDFAGKTFSNIEQQNDDELIFTLENGEKYRLYHQQECCEDVTIDDINGNLTDLIGTPVLMAEETTHVDINPDGLAEKSGYEVSFTWTFYRLGTVKGYVTIRWYGDSNGYYSESVDFEKVKE